MLYRIEGNWTFETISKYRRFLAKIKGEKLHKIHFFRVHQAQNILNQLSGLLRNASFKKLYSLAISLVWIELFLPH